MTDEGLERSTTDTAPARERDEIMRRVLEAAAAGVRRHPVRDSFREELLVNAVVSAWHLHAPGGQARPRARIAVPGWEPQPGQTDLALSMPGDPHATAIAELKIFAVEHTLWDLLKMLSILDGEGRFVRGYLIVATTPRRWRAAEVAALYEPADSECPDGVREWRTERLVSGWPGAWRNLLQGGSGRPRDVPGGARTTFLGSHAVPTFPGYELRAIAVEPLASAGRLRFRGDGWPARSFGGGGGGGGDFDLRDLLDAHLAAQRFRDAHPDLRGYHETRASALAGAFGIDLHKPPPDDDGLAVLLEGTLATIASIGSPFDRYLEAPRSVSELHQRHDSRIDDANDVLGDKLMDLAIDTVAALWRTNVGATVSAAELAAHGFDISKPAPDPLEYQRAWLPTTLSASSSERPSAQSRAGIGRPRRRR